MNEEIDESEFYHQDFTTASEWEIFIARMEEIIHEWKVETNKGNVETSKEGIWNVKCEKIPFADVEFNISLYKNASNELDSSFDEDDINNKNPIDTSHDFIERDSSQDNIDSCISLWYGLDEFIVLSPLSSNAAIVSESRIKILLSSAHIVVNNVNCEIPIFIQIRDKWQRTYLGVYEGNGVRTNFEMIHLRRGPQHCQYLTGLIDLFKTKIMSPTSLDPIIVSVQLTYQLNDYGIYVWKQDLPDIDHETFDSSTIINLPLGVTVDPISNIILKASWSHLPDNQIVDSENYSNFDPMQAPKWTTYANFSEQPVCVLSDCLTDFLHLFNNNSTIYEILGDFASSPTPDTMNPLDLLTESKVPTITSVLKRAARNSLTKNRRGTAPLSEEILVPMLYFMFPDAEDEPQHPYYAKREKDSLTSNEMLSKMEQQFRGFKTCGIDSLVWRLSIVLSQALHSLGGNRSLAHLWFEFVQEMRFRWEKCVPVPGLSAGFPDARTCLLHQKLQMLNCCIERKKARESAINTTTDEIDNATQNEDSSTDDEEFFDCSDEETRRKEKHSLWNQPVGRLGKFEDLKLLVTGDPMYIPITQEPVPKTEDQLEEDTDVLLKLGSDAAGSELRARMMSASLLSDMESFKAANPGSILEDFIRWYSPRDWLEDDAGTDEWGQRKGHLSSRMLISDNTWVEMWKSAKPVPANRQKRLFDDTREAEKVLHFIDSRTAAQISDMLLPVLAHAAIYRLAQDCEQLHIELPDSTDTLQHLIKNVERISRDIKIPPRRYEMLVQEIMNLELCVSQANSLLYKFNPSGSHDEQLSAFVANMIRGREVEVTDKADSKIGKRILAMFCDAQKSASMILTEQGTLESRTLSGAGNGSFPQASEREFVMRVSASRPAAYSAKTPQLLRAILSKNEFRLCGAFSEDIVFF